MPDMKNCVFADVVLLMEHTGKDSDKILKRKQIKFDDNNELLVIYQNKLWYVNRNFQDGKLIERFYQKKDYLTTGKVVDKHFSRKTYPLKKR
ncbi:hypothetical protein NDS46_30380 (plasmid) [Paenibacillus thiaminolyticus]|uniref:hypothetical protein n=1 Tax=Paenibacillus thiaminolyticus TaxID=49283 RepID=UPI00232CC547|nr:hypothetical protein [Paenibacillus thiaminolyticus]WCF11656.1 hypothetical protein NDS46_30380 [Paenibacillus thiaminolyticus]